MKTREERIAFDRNYCTHYAPKPGTLKVLKHSPGKAEAIFVAQEPEPQITN